jgi:amino acid adenylation domain-containing protein
LGQGISTATRIQPEPALDWSDRSDLPLDWNGPVHRPFEAFPDEARSRPIIELLEMAVCRYPRHTAFADARNSLTYVETWRTLAAWAERISQSSAPGDLVGILTPVSTAFPVAMLACLAAGRPFVALDPNYPPDWIARALDNCRPSLLLVTNATRRTAALPMPDSPRILNLDADCGEASPAWRPAPSGPDEPACVLFTSGSTGAPKGIVNSQRNLLQRVNQSINAAHINSYDRFLTLTSPCTIVGVRDMITAALAGASLFLLDSQKAGAREVLRVIRDRRISILFAFPALLRSIVAAAEAVAEESLRLVRIGGDTTLWSDIALLRHWTSPGTSIQLIYAATEAPMMQWFVGESANGHEERIPVGYPLSGNALAVVDESGASVREGEIGELLVRSPYVALGIWSRGGCETQAILTDAHDCQMRILRTGDLVRRRPDGLYDRIGRKDRQVKIRGARVELDGVEAAIRRHDCVRDVAVIARADDEGNVTRLVAYVQLCEGAPQDSLRGLRHRMRQTVPLHMQPWRFYRTSIIPRLPNSKLNAGALRAMDLASLREEADAHASSAAINLLEEDHVEALVAHIWRDVLGLRLSTATDDFFDLGGDSLGAIAMTAKLEKALGRELPITLINQAPTFAAFCCVLRDNERATYSPLVVLKPGYGLTPVFFVHGVGGSVMELFGLARKVAWPGPVIGIQARGLDGNDVPNKTVEAMADEYLTAVKSRQPEGPYFLCGYSFGGLVAYELARRLRDRGDEVAFVGLFATLPPGHRFLRLWAWTAYLYRSLVHRVVSYKKLPLHLDTLPAPAGALEELRAVAVSALSASAAYRPGLYAGEVTLFEPGHRDLGLPSSAKLWRQYTGALRRVRLHGRHDNMLAGVNAGGAADLLSKCLDEAVSA